MHYLNQSEVVAHWVGRRFYREIHYARSGAAGQPQGVTVRFQNQDHQPVEIEITMDARPLRPAGLTDQAGHAAARHFLVFFREHAALAMHNRVVIAGEDFSFNTMEGVTGTYRFMAAYSANVYTVVLPFTTTGFRYEHDQLSNTAGTRFAITPTAEEASTRHAEGVADVVHLVTSPRGGLQAYVHQAGEHRFTIRFDPPLVLQTAEPSAPVTYSMGLDARPDLVRGHVQIRREGQRVVLEWRHASPLWTQDYAFQSVITFEEDGSYQLTVSPLR